MRATLESRAEHRTIVERLARAQARARRLSRGKFVAVWVGLVLGIGAILWYAGRVDPDFIVNSGPVILLGIETTIFVSASAIVLSSVLAVIGALARLSSNPYISGAASLYVSFFRGTPLLVQILFIYFGLPQVGIILPAVPAGIVALGLNYGAYMTEIFRAGIQAVPPGQREAAAALGMPNGLVTRRIVLPQATRIVTPAIGNEFIAMLKDSTLVSFIGVPELLWRAERIGRSAAQPLTAILLAAVIYWVLTMIFSFFQNRLEGRMARSDR